VRKPSKTSGAIGFRPPFLFLFCSAKKETKNYQEIACSFLTRIRAFCTFLSGMQYSCHCGAGEDTRHGISSSLDYERFAHFYPVCSIVITVGLSKKPLKD